MPVAVAASATARLMASTVRADTASTYCQNSKVGPRAPATTASVMSERATEFACPTPDSVAVKTIATGSASAVATPRNMPSCSSQ